LLKNQDFKWKSDISSSCCIWTWNKKIFKTYSILIWLIIYTNIINTSKGKIITWITTNCIFWFNEMIFWWWNVVRICDWKIKDYFEESLSNLFEEFHERRVYPPKWYLSFDVINVVVDHWFEALNKCFHFFIWCCLLMTRLSNDILN
jgi:hypothetical protein